MKENTNKSSDNKQNCNWLKENLNFCRKILDIAGIILVLITILSIITMLINYNWNTTNQNSNNNQTFLIQHDITSSQKKLKNHNEQDIKELKTIIDIANRSLKELKDKEIEIELKQKEKDDNLRLYITIIAIIFTSVGFFGFKSIFDTRQSAVDKAVSEAKEKAEKIAEKEANKIAEEVSNKIAEEVANKIAEEVAEKATKEEVKNYLDNKLDSDHLKILEQTLITPLENKLIELKNDIEKLNDAYKYSDNNRPDSIKEIDNNFSKIVAKINILEVEMHEIRKDTFEKLLIEKIKNEKNKLIL
ncbi:hypothetical protein [Empedobacter brevis]|uniref:hypothetical protein n=1 Tax=Empedobacter brevis TaxID=247 RepID=UPI00289A0808|nr:hypothetical protein [Empedobacter brevis]